MSAFEEYIGLKIGVPLLVKLFLQNQLIRFLAKAAPGIRELVLVGKIWYERSFYDHVVVDMPSTGYALAMFQSIQNFSQLFKVGPIQGDTVKMHETLGDPQQAAQVIVSIAEETPLRESLELRDSLIKIYPRAQPIFVANKIYPRLKSAPTPDSQETGTPSPLARDGLAFIQSRNEIERANLQIWIDAKIPFTKIPYFPIEQDSLFEKRWMEALI
jgi:anion-transporting  ArsA/GET3 family ATPase